MKTLTAISLILVIVLVSLSAYLRLVHSGIGCSEWPQCYGRIGPAATATISPDQPRNAYQNLLHESAQPLAWATPLHRLVASLLGLAVLFLTGLAWRAKRHRVLTVLLLGLTVFLAVLGLQSGTLENPAVVMGNLAGGFAMLGLLGWLWFSLNPVRLNPYALSVPMRWPLLALLLLCLQIAMGGLTSANFAATSCQTLPDCHGSWWPGADITTALDLTRSHEVTASGQAIGGTERIAIHKAHRLGAIAAAVLILITAQLALLKAQPWRRWGIALGALLVAELTVGIAAVLAQLPITLAVAHNWLAGLMLLVLLKLVYLSHQAKR